MNLAEALVYLCMVTTWVFGIAIAQGFWMVLVAVMFPPFAWVTLAQYVLERLG
jgi:hypothetical protein